MNEREKKTEEEAGEAAVYGSAVPVRGRRRRIWPVVGLVVLILLAGASLLLLIPAPAAPPMPSFQFLSGQVPTWAGTEKNVLHDLSRESAQVYSFAADFNSICDAAHRELLSLGYVETPLLHPDPSMRMYQLRTGLPDELVMVHILDRHRYVIYSTPKNSEYTLPDEGRYDYEPGWVSVDIRQEYRGPWLSDSVERRGIDLLHRAGLRKMP